MHIEDFRNYCLSKPATTEEFPFGDETMVFKVQGKIFALASLDTTPVQYNLKCDPEYALQLREQYVAVRPGYHMNKKHWNTVVMDGSVKVQMLQQWIDHSYKLVVQSLPKSKRPLVL